MDELRFARIEDRVERMDEKIDGMKEDIFELKSDFKVFSHNIERHVTGDEKIISEIQPTLRAFQDFVRNDLPIIKEIANQEMAKKELDKMTAKKLARWKLIGGTVAAVASGIFAIDKIFKFGFF